MINALLTHLWQSTLFAVAAGLLTIAFRKDRAKVRFWLWLSASFKFLIPFALLMNLGSRVEWTPAARQVAAQIATPAVSYAVEYVAQPFPDAPNPAFHATPASRQVDWPLLALLSIWACGFVAIAVIRLRLWLAVRGALRVSTPLETPTAVEARVAPGLLEPGVVGFLKPVLFLPEGIVDRLTGSQLEAVLAHELCHVRRRDNLFASIHMIVEAVFWFHPLVWWIGARLVEERERACDEEVLSLGNQPRDYADAILNVCRLYAESPLVCVTGVTGSDIKRRIEAIMTNRGVRTLNRAKKIVLATAGLVAVAGPVMVGVVIGFGRVPAIHAQAPITVPLPAPPANLPLAQVAQASPAMQATTPLPVAPDVPGAAIIPYKDRRLVAMLFDFSTMSSDDQTRVKKTAVDFVHTQLNPADLVAVMVGGGGRVQVVHDFTDDKDALESSINHLPVGQGAGSPGDSGSGIDARLGNISTVAKMLAAFPEKKSLMYFSDGITQSGVNNQAQLMAVLNEAKQANIAIYPIDARGTATGIAGMDASQASGPIGGMVSGIPTGVSGGRGPGREPVGLPAGVSQDEYNQRVAYAESKLGSARTPMGRAYIQYAAPDQIDTPGSGNSQIWRYKYLDAFHGGAAFEFSTASPFGVRVIYPPPLATFEGRFTPEAAIQVAPLAQALDREAGVTVPYHHSLTGLASGWHVSLQIDAASPAMPTPPNGKFASFSIPLESLTGQVDIIAQARTAAGKVAATLRDGSQASVGTYRAAFALTPGSYTINVLVREKSTGHMFGETIDFDIQ